MEKYEPFKQENNPFDDKELLVINKTDKNQVSYKFSFLNKNSLLVGIFIFFTSPVTSHVTANLAREKGIVPVGKKIGKLL